MTWWRPRKSVGCKTHGTCQSGDTWGSGRLSVELKMSVCQFSLILCKLTFCIYLMRGRDKTERSLVSVENSFSDSFDHCQRKKRKRNMCTNNAGRKLHYFWMESFECASCYLYVGCELLKSEMLAIIRQKGVRFIIQNSKLSINCFGIWAYLNNSRTVRFSRLNVCLGQSVDGW